MASFHNISASCVAVSGDGGSVVMSGVGGGPIRVVSKKDGTTRVFVDGQEIKGGSIKRISVIVENEAGERHEVPYPGDAGITVTAQNAAEINVSTGSGAVNVSGGSPINQIRTGSGSVDAPGAKIGEVRTGSGSVRAQQIGVQKGGGVNFF